MSKILLPVHTHFIRQNYFFHHCVHLYGESKISFDMIKRPLKSLIFKAKIFKLYGLSTAFAVSLEQKKSSPGHSNNVFSENIDFSHRKLIQQACSSSVNSTSELLTQILVAIIDAASKYKNGMHDLMNELERDIELIGHGVVSARIEDDVVVTRVNTNNLKEEFLKLITLSENIEKLATATAEISFLVGAETLAMLISERLYSVQQKIRNEIEEVKRVESKCLDIQKSSILKRDQSSDSELLSHSLSDGDEDS